MSAPEGAAEAGGVVRRASTPAQAWAELAAGNARFVEGRHSHPNQDAARRHSLAHGPRPLGVFLR